MAANEEKVRELEQRVERLERLVCDINAGMAMVAQAGVVMSRAGATLEARVDKLEGVRASRN